MLGSLIVRRIALRFCSSAAAAANAGVTAAGAGQADTSSSGYSKNNLSKLRKRTGYTMSNCKTALEVNGNDLQKALEWLNARALKEGWAKAQKLRGRKTTQGLIGIHVQNNVAAMVEVNCETDFVSRNQEFHNLVRAVTSACHAHVKSDIVGENQITKTLLATENMTSLPWLEQSDKTLSDLVALKIGQLGENMALTRAICLCVSEDLQFGHYVHPSSVNGAPGFTAGKYGSIIAFKTLPIPPIAAEDDGVAEEPSSTSSKQLTTEDCVRQLCQHVVGMNPLTIGEKNDEPLEDRSDETQMIHQEFLVDPSMTVGEFLDQNGVQVLDFVRYECGETSEEPF